MDEQSKALAIALRASSESIHVMRWDWNDGYRVQVIAMRSDRPEDEDLRKAAETIRECTKAIAGPSGQPCPLCGGTGKI